ncbi:hypothetical protein LINPERHAP2_LOCUS33310, partial [Linum perenne]
NFSLSLIFFPTLLSNLCLSPSLVQIGRRLSGTKSAGDYLEPNRPATSSTRPSVLFFMMQCLVLALTLKMLPTLEMKLLKLRILWILFLAELVEMIKILDISLTIPLFFRCRVYVLVCFSF